MDKFYTVYYIIKKNNSGYLRSRTVLARNQKEAIREVKTQVKETTGRTAFSATCKKPEPTTHGMLWNGMIYTRWNEYTQTLW